MAARGLVNGRGPLRRSGRDLVFPTSPCGLHASITIYSPIKLDDLKSFRKLNSNTPGHPEYGKTPGVECTTGLLGQGIGMAVGMAYAERYFNSLVQKYKPKSKLINYYTYCFCGDGDLMEGVSYEALSFASTHKLNKLILIYDHNSVSLDSNCDITFTEDIETRFEALDFNVEHIKGSGNTDKLCEVIESCKKSKKPSIIIVDTVIGKGSRLENTNKVHGNPLSEEDINKIN